MHSAKNKPPRKAPPASLLGKDPVKVLGIAVGACLAILLAFIVASVTVFQSIGREIGVRNEKIDSLKESLAGLAGDYNLLRQSLGLEARDFSLDGEGGAETAKKDSPLVEGLKVIQNRFNDEKKLEAFRAIKAGDLLKALLKETGCSAVEAGPYSAELARGGDLWFAITFRPDEDQVRIEAAGIPGGYEGAWGQAAADYVRASRAKVESYCAKLPAERKRLAGLSADPAVAAALKDKALSLKARPEELARLQAVVMKGAETLLAVAFDKLRGAWSLGAAELAEPGKLAPALAAAIGKLDTHSPEEKRLEAVALALRESLLAPELAAFLAEAGLAVSATARETDDFLYYDVTQGGVKVGAFALAKKGAEVYFVDKDDIQIMALRSLARSPGSEAPAAPALSARGRTEGDAVTFLLLGRNEDNVDTIILAQADPRAKAISMVSLPRDLYYKGSRINRLARRGYEGCAREISAITGVPVEKYAVVDIYSLMSLIDLLGGVEVTLERDLIDPTYRIKEDGVWRTLAYPKGRYTLSGVQAMRVIRSRATTMDFDRSYRQQLVLAALLDKLRKRCGEDLDVAIRVFGSLLGYVTTNVSPLELAKYFLAFKDYRLSPPNVVDTSNILEQTWSALLYASEEDKVRLLEAGDEEELGAWILLPAGNDWGLLRSYVRSVLSRA